MSSRVGFTLLEMLAATLIALLLVTAVAPLVRDVQKTAMDLPDRALLADRAAMLPADLLRPEGGWRPLPGISGYRFRCEALSNIGGPHASAESTPSQVIPLRWVQVLVAVLDDEEPVLRQWRCLPEPQP